ncbi:MAG TPA: ExeM/NucH family extracellular endonuclease [Actinomycetota bacterium]
MIRSRRSRIAVLSTALVLTLAGVPGGLPQAGAVSEDLVVSQVYGGGGNSGAPLTHDYVEIFNRGDDTVSLEGLSLQYASATGTGHFGATSTQLTELPVSSVPPGGYILVQEAAGAGSGDPLPTPDFIDPTPIAMAAGAGKVALVTGTSSLGCNGGSTPCTAEQLERIVDLVGYGSANFFEGSAAAPGLSNSTAALRDQGGCTDTDDNASDFTSGAPAPRNSSSPLHDCEGNGNGNGDPDDLCEVEPADLTPISAIQGSGASTPIPRTDVVTRGVVTADFTSGGASDIPANQGLRGFFFEAITDDRDADPATSEGLFVFDAGGVFDGAIGDLVAVAGTAGEFSSVTQVSMSDFDVCAPGELPAPAGLDLPKAPADRDADYEPFESMRVTHPELSVIEFFQLERFGEIRLSASGVLQTPTNIHLPGSPDQVQLAADNAAAAIVLDDGRTGQNLNRLNSPDLLPYVEVGETLRIGDQVHDLTAVLHFGFGQWRLQPIDIDEITEALAAGRTRPRPEDPPEVGGSLKVASFNVLNYFDGDGQGGGFPNPRGATTASELARQTEKLVDAITRLGADVYGLIEIENDGGEFQAARTLVEALNDQAGREVYRFVDTGVVGIDEIKQAFVYNRWTVRPVGELAILTSEVDPRFDDTRSRPAIAQTFLRLGTGQRVTVVVNHFKSKGQSGLTDPSDPDFDQGDGQGFWNHTRTQSALALADWLATNPTRVQTLGALIIGDLNAYGREDPISALEDAGYEDQLVRFTDGPPYTFTFDGQQGALDTALALPALAARITGAAVWHINADEVPAIDYQESVGFPDNPRFRTPEIAAAYYDPTAFRSSDHDPVVVGIELRRDGG